MGITETSIVLKPGRHGADTFMPGDMVRGVVVISIGGSTPHKLSEVTLKVKGQARTNWTTHNGTWTSRHSQKESFLKLEVPVVRVRKDGPTALPPGENHFNFSFTLPNRLPHSHEYACGAVAYKLVVNAVSSQPLAWNGHQKRPITLLQRLDLRDMRQLARRLVVERKAKASSKRDDPGEFKVTLARQAFVAGETIDVYVQGSDDVLRALARNEGLVKLKRFEEFRAGSSIEQNKPVLVKKRLGLDPAEWRHFQLTMPKDDIGIDPDLCSIIAVSHYVKIWDVHLPVTLGTIPFGKRSSSGTALRELSRISSASPLALSPQTPSRAPPRAYSTQCFMREPYTPSQTLLSQTPSYQTPSSQTLLSQTPSSQTPLSQTPLSQTLLSQTPSSQTPLSQTPPSQTPLSQTPLSQTPLSQTPLSQKSGSGEAMRLAPVRTTDV